MSAENQRRSLPVGIAIGDPNGIGPEIAIHAAASLGADHGQRAAIFGDRYIVERECERLALDAGAFQVHDVPAMPAHAWRPGSLCAFAGAATVMYARAAVQACQAGQLAGVVAAPHCETAVNAAGIPFRGYGPLVADLTGTPHDRVFLMLCAGNLRVIHVTLHESIVQAVGRLTPTLVESAASAARDTLRGLGMPNPRLCILGINPHAGEGGLFGIEDESVTRPAVTAMAQRGWAVHGPAPADIALSEGNFDCYVAMLHDQGHIAIKMVSPKGAAALVAGAPVLFASAAHGAAFDRAGLGTADCTGMKYALALVARAAGRVS